MAPSTTLPPYEPTCVLVTGVTGFLGKVVLEELFRRKFECKVDKVVIIIRSKRGQVARKRFVDTIVSSPCFSELEKGWENAIEVLEGDLSVVNCGIEAASYMKVCKEITHIIHCAGSVSFEEVLDKSIAANTDSTLNVCKFAKHCPRLKQFVSTSTAYVAPQSDSPLYESLVELPRPAQEMLDDIRAGKLNEQDVLEMTRHPNTYTFTKCLTEHLIMEQYGELPVTIVRPSIISASRCYPFPGWIDSHAAFAAFIAAYGAGILRVVDGDRNTLLDVVPVDDVSRSLIDQTFLPNPERPESRIVYAVAGLNYATQIGLAAETIQLYFSKRPQSKNNKMHYLGPRNLVFHAMDIVHQRLPLRLATSYYTLRKDEKMAKQTRRAANIVKSINRVFPSFTNHIFDFRPSVPLLKKDFDVVDYLNVVCEGIESNILGRT